MQYKIDLFGVPVDGLLIVDFCPPVIAESFESVLLRLLQGIGPIMIVTPDPDANAEDGMFLSEESTEITGIIFDHIPPCFAAEKPLCDWREVEHGRLAARSAMKTSI